LTFLLVILYVVVCLFLIMVVLLQQGKGADLAGAFGGGGSQTSFGPRTTTNIMHRLTTGSFVLFVVLSMSLAILSGKRHKSVIQDVEAATPTPAAVEPALDEPALEAPIEDNAEGDQAAADEAAE
jgi:preprotein translocase subunit SecG